MMDLIPGFVHSYNAVTRTVRVEIPGLTDGADIFPEAEFCYPIGDKSEHTEIRILPGDRVWLAFQNGDARYPIIMGYRPKQTGNLQGWRKFHHDNMAIDVDGQCQITAESSVTITVGDSVVTVTPSNVTVTATAINFDTPEASFSGNVTIAGSVAAPTVAASVEISVAGKAMSNHVHREQGDGNLVSPPV